MGDDEGSDSDDESPDTECSQSGHSNVDGEETADDDESEDGDTDIADDEQKEEREDSFSFNLETADCIPFEFVMSPIQEQTPIDLESNGLTLRQLSCSPNADAFTPED